MTAAPKPNLPHVAILTAGGAGMFCGSCMHDNTWARVLKQAGYEVSLIPAYTPIRVDEENLSSSKVVFGGVNVYLNSSSPLWRALPSPLKRWLDHPAIIRSLTRWGLSTEARQLGEITLAMLEGEQGSHRTAVEDLARYFAALKPDVVLFTNALLSGGLRMLRSATSARMLCILQGDDIFLEGLIEPYRSQVLEQVRLRAKEFDGFVVHSRYYRDFMADYLQLPRDRFHFIPLSIDTSRHDGAPKAYLQDPPVVGYFARICEEKGLHRLVEAALKLRRKLPRFKLHAAGYMAPERKPYLDSVRRAAQPLGGDFAYFGSPATHAEKVAFLKSLDVLSVPTVYHEPKGLFVLESLANGVPAVLPAHGAFPELVESAGGVHLFPANDLESLADGLERVLTDSGYRRDLAETGWQGVRRGHDFEALAAASMALFGQ
jgi:glycosyltransferase involved in cell wall biosynthesis